MSKGRKTTLEERTEIVAFCIANGKDLRIDSREIRRIISAGLFVGS